MQRAGHALGAMPDPYSFLYPAASALIRSFPPSFPLHPFFLPPAASHLAVKNRKIFRITLPL
jgi:hypothetical protein